MTALRKTTAIILAAICLLGVLSGCGASEAPQTVKTHTVVDVSGHSVEVPEKVDAYVSLWVGTVTVCMMLDEGEHMVGCSKTAASYPMFERAYSKAKELAYFTDDSVTTEGILETGASVVFYRGKDNADLAEELSKAGIAAIDVEFNTYDEMMTSVDIIADVLNTDYAREKSVAYKAYAKDAIERAQKTGNEAEEKASVIVIRDASDLKAYGVNRFAGKWATICGGDYALKDGDPDGYVNLTDEQLVEYDPDVIVFVIPGEAEKFTEDPKWSSLSAVKNGRVYENPSAIGTWSNHGAECVLQFGWATEKLYGYTDTDLVQEVRDFYKEFFGIEFTDTEIDAMINAG